MNLTINGSGLTGATKIVFDTLNAESQGDNGNDKNRLGSAFIVTNVTVNTAGTQITAVVQIGADAQTGRHVVRIVTPNGESSGMVGAGNVFTVSP